MNDSFGRDIHYMRISVTDRCNLRCRYCMPESGLQKIEHQGVLTYDEIIHIVEAGVALGIRKIRLTGGEPLVRKGSVELVRMIKNVKGVEELVMTTNGLLLEQAAKDLKTAGLDRINISLDTLNAERFKTITRGGDLDQVLVGIEAAKAVGLTPIKINVVLIGGFNEDEVGDFIALTKDSPVDVRFIELMPMGEARDWATHHFIPCEQVLKVVKHLELMTRQEAGSPAIYYQLPKAKGRVGLIRPLSCSFCEGCNRIRITSDGMLKTCLHQDTEYNLKHVLRSGGSVSNVMSQAILEKPKAHGLTSGQFINRNMVSIGG